MSDGSRWRAFGVRVAVVAVAGLVLAGVTGAAAQPVGLPPLPLPDGPRVFDSAEQSQFRLVVVTSGLSHPWGMAFLPDGGVLVTERAGQLRVIRGGVLDPQPISGVPGVHARGLAGLMDVAIHPRFSENQLVYLTYSKPGDDGVRVAVARGRLTGSSLTDVDDLFMSDLVGGGGPAASRVVFRLDGTLLVTVGGALLTVTLALSSTLSWPSSKVAVQTRVSPAAKLLESRVPLLPP